MRTLLAVVGSVILFIIVGFLIISGRVILFNYWTELALALTVMAFALLAWGFKPYFFKEPSFKIENPRISHHNVGTKDEFKDLFFDLRNKGKTRALGCDIKIKVKDFWEDFYSLILPRMDGSARYTYKAKPTNISSGDKITIQLCQVEKKAPAVRIRTIDHRSSVLYKGQKYTLEMRITGENFTEKEVPSLELDLSSWEKIGIKLDHPF